MEEKKNEQIINEKQDCQELDDNALEDTSGGIGERTLPDFHGWREFDKKLVVDVGLDVGNPDV